jgi:hypothetical protein
MFDTRFGPPKRQQQSGLVVTDSEDPPDHLSAEQKEAFRKTRDEIKANGRLAHAYLHPAPIDEEEPGETPEGVADFLAAVAATQKP